MSHNAEDQVIADVSKAIYASLSFSEQNVVATMNLPSADQTDTETLALALQYLLVKAFKLTFPAAEMIKVSKGKGAEFSEEVSLVDLPPRQISICQRNSNPQITISGVAAKDGRNASSELHFQWKKQAGAQDEHGNTDLKKLNSYPTVQEGELLATIRERTFGTPGIDCQGKTIKPIAGNPLELKFDENTVERRSDEADTSKYYLYANKSGIAAFSLLQQDNSKTLNKIGITNTITIKGDIDYSVGDLSDEDLGCGAINIVVNGDVRGAFSLKSKGYISVSGTVDGQKVLAKNIQINVITADSEAIAKDQVIVGTLIKAKARGRIVTIKRASNDSELIGVEQVKLEKGANCLALTIKTRELLADTNNFSGRTTIFLGQDLFDQEKQLLEQLEADNTALAKSPQEITEFGESATFNYRQLKIYISQGVPSASAECREHLGEIKEELESALQDIDRPLHPKLVNRCYSLQNLIDGGQEAEDIFPKIESLTNSLQILNKALQDRCAVLDRIKKSKTAIQGLRHEVEKLRASFENPQFITNNSDIIIRSGSQQITFDKTSLPDSPFDVTYELTGETGISKGKLVYGAGESDKLDP